MTHNKHLDNIKTTLRNPKVVNSIKIVILIVLLLVAIVNHDVDFIIGTLLSIL